MDAFGSNPSQVKGQSSTSRSPSDTSAWQRRQILAVEDNKADVFLIRKAIEAAAVNADLHVVHDGQAATNFFDATDADDNALPPDLVLLDLNLPKKSGDDVLKHLRNSPRCRDALVLIVTSSDSDEERNSAAAQAVAGYFRKPSQYDAFMELGLLVKQLLGRSNG
jgi:chemotaxis family two-component system response regulator Rcp1